MTSRHVVVVGHGMAGARLAGEIRSRDPRGETVALTVLGAEPRPAYNRVLLSSVVAGSLDVPEVTTAEPDWGRHNQVDLRLGTTVEAIDRDRRQVLLADGGQLGYDALVLATGSRPWIPPVPGLSNEQTLAPGVVAFRTVVDCERIVSCAVAGEPIVVLGGGVLGLETARGLAGRGCPVTVVHPSTHLMDRQLDPMAGRLLADALARVGVATRLGRRAVGYQAGHGVQLDDDTLLPAGLVVVATGVRADTGLAARAGLAVAAGVTVDDQLRSTDPAIYAIGDCAEHRGVSAGLVESAFAQAAVLAELLTAPEPTTTYLGTPTVTRLKARDIELTALGESLVPMDATHAEVQCVSDPLYGRYAKVVLREDRVVGAIVLGLPDAAATVTQFFDSGATVPSDRLPMLLGSAVAGAGTATDPAALPVSALVCRCNSVTKGRLASAWAAGATDVDGLIRGTRASTGCGSCRQAVSDIARWLAEQHEPGMPAISAGA